MKEFIKEIKEMSNVKLESLYEYLIQRKSVELSIMRIDSVVWQAFDIVQEELLNRLENRRS